MVAGGTTFHTGLKFKFGTEYLPLEPQQLHDLRQQFERMMMIIIDEMSLVSADYFYNIHRRFVEILHLSEMFADRAVMLVGDLLQIPPVMNQQHGNTLSIKFSGTIFEIYFVSGIFMKPQKLENKCLYNSDANLWDSCEVVNLKTNFRVGNKVWKETLERIRYGEQTLEDYELLRSRYTSNFSRNDWDNAIHTFFTNKEVHQHNIKVLNNIQKPLITIAAELPKGKHKAPTEHGTIDETNFSKDLHLKIGAIVMHIHNTGISDGLVNGVTGMYVCTMYVCSSKMKCIMSQLVSHSICITGKVIDFVYRTINGKREVYAVIVKFDDDEIGQQCRKKHLNLHPAIENKNGVPIFKIKYMYKSKRRGSSRKTGKDLWLRQVPLNLAFGTTGHKLQGRTIKNQEIVAHGHSHIDYGEGYVMLSRCKNIEQVFLDKSFIPEKHLKPHKPSLIEARKLEERCIAAKFKDEKFDIFYINMRAKSNFEDVQNDPFAKQSSLVCLTQTCLTSNEVFQWPGRRSLPHASLGDGKGVFCITDEEQNTLFRSKMVTDKFQLVKVTMRDKFQIFTVYVSPNANHQVYQALSDAIDGLIMPGLEPIIIGDFNFDTKETNPLSSYMNEMGMKQLIKEPTFALGSKTIDHIYVSPFLEETLCVSYRYNYYSDHCSFNLTMK